MFDTRDVAHRSISSFVSEVVALTLDGWAVAGGSADTVGHGSFTVSMYRDADSVENLRSKSLNIDEKPKETRAEQLARARSIKAGKAKLDTGTVQVL